jgi:hypothetical protein
MLPAQAASAQTPAAPTENVTVTGAKSREALENFAKAFITTTKRTGKIARWERGVCPLVMGQKPDVIGFITQRVKAVAEAVGAPVNSEPACTPNIEIIFTTTPQALMDSTRKNNPDYLGYATTSDQRDRLATVIRPIQAWYLTETVDLDGVPRIDSGRMQGSGIAMSNFSPITMPSTGPGNRDPIYMPDATYARVTGNHINDGARSNFHHILIVVDSTRLAGQKLIPLADYITMLALTQLNVLDTCQQLPSIVNLLATNCDHGIDGITANDLAYLHALYTMGSDKSGVFQKDDIADAMVDRLAKGK